MGFRNLWLTASALHIQSSLYNAGIFLDHPLNNTLNSFITEGVKRRNHWSSIAGTETQTSVSRLTMHFDN